MKSFDEIREIDKHEGEFLEERILRKGAGLMFAARSKSAGDKAERHFEQANQYLQQPKKPKDTLEDRVEVLIKALSAHNEGMISLRNQNGAITSLCLTAVLLSEKKPKRKR
jgi:hypothetical protein